MPNALTNKRFFAFAIILYSLVSYAAAAAQAELDYPYLGEGHFFDGRSMALGGAGCALPYGISSTPLNPALLETFDRMREHAHGGVYAGFGRDSMFSSTIFPAGIWYTQPLLGSTGLGYRFLQRSDTNSQSEFSLTHSKRFFEKSLSQGPVDYGLALRYEKTEWVSENVLDSLYKYHYDSTQTLIGSSYSDWSALKHIRQGRLVLDLGFFQSSIAEHLDFGITFKNLLGYAWTQTNPYVAETLIVLEKDTITLDNQQYIRIKKSLDSVYYVHEYKQSEHWFDLRYKNILTGICFHNTISDMVSIAIPADLEFTSLFDSRQKKGVIFRVGLEAVVNQVIYLRGGYARAPLTFYDGEEIKAISRFSGGAGFHTEFFNVDLYLTVGQWGLAASTAF
jgi:hypothetical protein